MAGEGLKLFTPNHTQQETRAARAEQRRLQIPVRDFYLKSRRVGITTDSSADTYSQVYGNDNYNALIVAHDKERAASILGMSHLFQEQMPDVLKQKLARSTTGKIKFARANSELAIMTAASVMAGRGGTLHALLISEYAWCDQPVVLIREIEQSLIYHYSTQGIIETTALAAGSPAHQFWVEGKKNKLGQKVKGNHWWRSHFLNWMNDPNCSVHFRSDRDTVEQMEQAFWEYPELKDRMQHYNMTPGQLVFYYHFVKKCKGDLLFCQQEYPCDDLEAWIASGSPIFPLSLIGKYQSQCKRGWMLDPQIDGRYQMFKALSSLKELEEFDPEAPYLEVWEKPVLGRKYLIAADCADGYATSDYSCAMVFDLKTMEQCAEFHGHLDASEFALFLMALGWTYNTAVLAPEVNGIGQAVLSKIRENYANVYIRRRDTASGVKMDGKLGWHTDTASRPLAVANGKRIFREMAINADQAKRFIRSSALCDELRTFVTGRNGRPEAAHGCYDDRVMTWLIGLTAIMYEVYGKLCDEENIPSEFSIGEKIEKAPRMGDLMEKIMNPGRGWSEVPDLFEEDDYGW